MLNVHDSTDLLLDADASDVNLDDELLGDEDDEEKLDSKDTWGIEEEFE